MFPKLLRQLLSRLNMGDDLRTRRIRFTPDTFRSVMAACVRSCSGLHKTWLVFFFFTFIYHTGMLQVWDPQQIPNLCSFIDSEFDSYLSYPDHIMGTYLSSFYTSRNIVQWGLGWHLTVDLLSIVECF